MDLGEPSLTGVLGHRFGHKTSLNLSGQGPTRQIGWTQSSWSTTQEHTAANALEDVGARLAEQIEMAYDWFGRH